MADNIDSQLKLLDLEEGAIVVLRTRGKLQPSTAAAYQDKLERLCRAQGYREVGVIVLDDCSDLTIERRERPETRMAHQPPRPLAIVSR